MAIVAAVIFSVAFGGGYKLRGWIAAATDKARLEAALEAAVTRMDGIAQASQTTADNLAQINQDARVNSQRIATYVEATNACRITPDDIRVFTSNPDGANTD